ncbi:hypothetical protein ABZ913_35990, partial [Streptosporangium sandarakinum]
PRSRRERWTRGRKGRRTRKRPPALVTFARRVADEHHATHGAPITPETLRARLGVSDQLAADLLRTLHAVPEAA